MEIIFFGNERLATGVSTNTPVIKALIDAGFTIKAVIANHAEANSRQKRRLEIDEIARAHSIPVILPRDKKELEATLEMHKADAAVLVAFGRIVPKNVIDLFPKGIINLHPSLLPKLRGPTPIETAILEGHNETGVSLMKITSKMDAGPIFTQKKISISGKETKQALADKLSTLGATLLAQELPAILSGAKEAIEQDETQASYTKMIQKKDGVVDWSLPAEQIERQIRAYSSWPKLRAKLGQAEFILCEATPESAPGTPGRFALDKSKLTIFCGKESLSIKRVQPAGKAEMDIESFLAGYKNKLTD